MHRIFQKVQHDTHTCSLKLELAIHNYPTNI